VNLGRRTVCHAHRDFKNLAYGVCLDLALGKFDPAKGGHLVLHELRTAVELGAGDVLFFPSAVVTHENVGIQPGEVRYSMTAFSAGSLFQYRDQGFETKKALVARGSTKVESARKGLERFSTFWGLFSTLEGLEKPRRKLDDMPPSSDSLPP
ncbi:hypothetical protein BOTBODRAFT_122173, partial [Botryobasidium botryosum FD-172 SS1]